MRLLLRGVDWGFLIEYELSSLGRLGGRAVCIEELHCMGFGMGWAKMGKKDKREGNSDLT
jgi:hypothetical protein